MAMTQLFKLVRFIMGALRRLWRDRSVGELPPEDRGEGFIIRD